MEVERVSNNILSCSVQVSIQCILILPPNGSGACSMKAGHIDTSGIEIECKKIVARACCIHCTKAIY